MKKLLSILLSIAMLISVFAVVASAQSVAPAQPKASSYKLNAGSFKSFAAKFAQEIDEPVLDDIGEGELPDFFEMTREEYIAYFTPENASENLKAFTELFFGMIYDMLYYYEEYPEEEFPDYDDSEYDAPAFATVDEYLQYMIDETQSYIDYYKEVDEAFLKLTEEEMQMLADKLNEYFDLFNDEIETPDDVDPGVDDPGFNDPDFEDPDVGDFDDTITVEDIKTIHDSLIERIENYEDSIETVKSFTGSDTFEEDIKTLARIAALLDAAQNDCKINYYQDSQERFYNEYENGFYGYLVSFDELEYFDVMDYVDYFFSGICEGSFVLYLYADVDNLTALQIENLREVQSLLATLNSDVMDYLNDYLEVDCIANFENDLVTYVGPMFTYGDANNDGNIDMLDVLLIRKYIAKQPVEINADAANVVSDANIDMLDVLLIRKYIAKQPVELGPKG